MTDQPKPQPEWQTMTALGFLVVCVGLAVALVILAWGAR